MLGGGGGHTFRDMGGVVLRYGSRCDGVEGVIHFKIWGGCFEIWEVLF